MDKKRKEKVLEAFYQVLKDTFSLHKEEDVLGAIYNPPSLADELANTSSLTITNTTTDNSISIDQNGNVGTDVATDGALHIENTENTGIGLGVYTNIGVEDLHVSSMNNDLEKTQQKETTLNGIRQLKQPQTEMAFGRPY
jgi:hypothetical protein